MLLGCLHVDCIAKWLYGAVQLLDDLSAVCQSVILLHGWIISLVCDNLVACNEVFLCAEPQIVDAFVSWLVVELLILKRK